MTARNRTTVRRLAILSASAFLALGLGACTSDAPETTDGSSTATSESPSSTSAPSASASASDEDAPGTDQSAELFEAYSDPEPVGETVSGDWTLEVFELRSTATGTRLAFHLSSPEFGQADMDARYFNEFPEIIDRSGETIYQPITVTQSAYENEDERQLCVCTGQGIVNANPRMQNVLYETLPEDVSSVDVSYGDFDPLTVEVTH